MSAQWFVNPLKRRFEATKIRQKLILEFATKPIANHQNNGDETNYPYWGNFHKTLPHSEQDGSVDPVAYEALLAALKTGKYEDFEAVPKGSINGAKLLNPIGAGVYNIFGPDSSDIAVTPPPSISTKQWAADLVNIYWMSLLRDTPFSDYETLAQDPTSLVSQALLDLNEYGANYPGPKTGGVITTQDLFRMDIEGTRKGPIVSQFLLRDFDVDGITVSAKINEPQAGADYVTNWDDFIKIQNGESPLGSGITKTANTVYPSNTRQVGCVAGSDLIYSTYNRALSILRSAPVDPANPYATSTRQSGFSTFGLAHYTYLMGQVHMAERQAWYTKWLVHRFLRPEAAAGLVHAKFFDAVPRNASIPLDDEIADKRALVELKNKYDSYLLPLMFKNGGPTHPSFTAGHAISAGACITLLKALFDTSKTWKELFGQPKYSADGVTLVDYTGPETLTINDELNKLAQNMANGRDMSGVHWYSDDIEGLKLGEEVAIRILRDDKQGVVEPFAGFTLHKFDGTVITI